jgi:cell division septum initiation protein DivIVA
MSSIGSISGTTAYSALSARGSGASGSGVSRSNASVAALPQGGSEKNSGSAKNTSGLEAALRQAQAAESQARRQLAAAMAQSGSDGPQVTADQAAVSRAGGAVRDAQAKLDASKLAVDILA